MKRSGPNPQFYGLFSVGAFLTMKFFGAYNMWTGVNNYWDCEMDTYSFRVSNVWFVHLIVVIPTILWIILAYMFGRNDLVN